MSALYSAKVFCDFDGTISQVDVVDFLLGRLADPKWEEVEAVWLRGEIGSRECLARQIPLIKGGWKAIESVLDEISLEPTFADFASWCASRKIPLYVISEGLDRVIHYLLDRGKIKVSGIWANQLVETTDGGLELRFPYAPKDPDCRAGLCKCEFLNRAPELDIVIGDGRSDFCWASKAHWVFAKSKLLTYCQESGIPHEPLLGFNHVRMSINQLLKRGTPARPAAPKYNLLPETT